MEELLEILEDMYPDVDFATEDELVTGKIFNSFDIISIVGEFNDAFDIDIDVEDLEPYNFNTLEAMEELIKKLQEED